MKIKNCPFCGGEASVYFAPENKLNGIPCYGVACEKCRVMIGTVQFGQTDFFRCKENAIEAWNRREPIGKIVEQLEERADKANDYWVDGLTYFDGKEDGIREAIEIVKSGGVEL